MFSDKILPNVSKEIYIENQEYSKASLEKVVKASGKCDRLILRFSKFDLEKQPDFSGVTYTTTYLSFYNSGDNHNNNWSGNEYRFINMVKGIANCGLKSSLATLNISGCGISVDRVKQIMASNSMSSIAVTDDKGPKYPITK